MKKYILSLILLFLAVPVYAEVLYSQVNKDAYFIASAPNIYGQRLGTGLTGTVRSVSFYMAPGSAPYSVYNNARIFEYSDSGYTTCSNSFYASENGSTQHAVQVTTEGVYDWSFVKTAKYTGCAGVPSFQTDGFQLDPTKYYYLTFWGGETENLPKWYGTTSVLFGSNCKSGLGASCPSSVKDLYYVLSDGTGFNSETEIISVTPYDGEVVASTTPTEIGFEAYINGDYDSSTLTFKVHRLNDLNDYGGMSGQVWEYSTTTNEVGPISYSKIVPSLISFLDPGNYILTLDIRPSTIFSFFTPTSVATSTMFYVGDATRFGLDYAKSQDEYRDFFSDISQSATSSLADFCDFTSPLGGWLTGGLVENTWDIGKCLRSLLVPNALEVKAVFDSYKGQVLYAFPLGYVTRSIDIMTGTTTLPLPALTYTFENDFPSAIFAGETFGFDFTEIASDASDILDTQFVSASE